MTRGESEQEPRRAAPAAVFLTWMAGTFAVWLASNLDYFVTKLTLFGHMLGVL